MSAETKPVAAKTALVIIDLQNDFLDAKGAYARAGSSSAGGLVSPPRA